MAELRGEVDQVMEKTNDPRFTNALDAAPWVDPELVDPELVDPENRP